MGIGGLAIAFAAQKTLEQLLGGIIIYSENSLELRKRLLELANERISKKLKSYSIEFTTEEPTIYVDYPITL